ncbi:hypothetical protein EON65_49755, partial [archaeon]
MECKSGSNSPAVPSRTLNEAGKNTLSPQSVHSGIDFNSMWANTRQAVQKTQNEYSGGNLSPLAFPTSSPNRRPKRGSLFLAVPVEGSLSIDSMDMLSSSLEEGGLRGVGGYDPPFSTPQSISSSCDALSASGSSNEKDGPAGMAAARLVAVVAAGAAGSTAVVATTASGTAAPV